MLYRVHQWRAPMQGGREPGDPHAKQWAALVDSPKSKREQHTPPHSLFSHCSYTVFLHQDIYHCSFSGYIHFMTCVVARGQFRQGCRATTCSPATRTTTRRSVSRVACHPTAAGRNRTDPSRGVGRGCGRACTLRRGLRLLSISPFAFFFLRSLSTSEGAPFQCSFLP